MLPYTTYSIPDAGANKTPDTGRAAWCIVAEEISASAEALLEKICQAIQMDLRKDIGLLNINHDPFQSFSTLSPVPPALVISFGVLPNQIGYWIDLEKPGMLQLEHTTFILTSALPELERNMADKKLLWGFLQQFLAGKTE